MKTYYVMIAEKYLTTVYENDGQITQTIQHPHQEQAAIWTYAEATELCARLVKQTGQLDFCEMVEAIEEDEYETTEYKDEHQKRADALAEQADDSRDDR